MMVNDPIADMLTRIRNAYMAQHDTVSIPLSSIKKGIAEILTKEGYILSYEVIEGAKPSIVVTLKYNEKKKSVISGLKRISKPGLRVYASVDEIPRVLNGLGIAIVSTNLGLMTDKQARSQKVGGEVLAFVW
ncbi:MAG: 30S ribosomal protein S8 [Bacilli bacterium]